MHITMVGTGYVGLVTGTCFANTGNDVTCLDVDQGKIDRLRAGESPIYEPGLEELIRRNSRNGRLHFSTDRQAAYQGAQVVFICVGTPSDEWGRADLSHVLAAARELGEAMEAAPGESGGELEERRAKIVVVKSTVPVGTHARVREAIADRTGKRFRMASNPEFLKEGAAIADFQKPDRVILGAEDEGTADRLRDLYEPFVRQGNPIYVMDLPSAEMVKYASNAMLATKISFINEIANLCEAFGADVDEVRQGMCSDSRIGNKFLYPGLGYGGSCFPKDVLACLAMGEQSGTPTNLLGAVHQVNQNQRATFLRKILDHFGGQGAGDADQGSADCLAGPLAARAEESSDAGLLAGVRLAIWGIAFKPGTDDIREAPSITLMHALLDRGAELVCFDSVAESTCRAVFGDRVGYAAEPYEALEGARALVICTDWDEFKHPDFEQMRARMSEPVIFDGRNLYRRSVMTESGFTYYSVGRDPIHPPTGERGAVMA